MLSLKIIVMKQLGKFYDEVLGDRYTGWYAMINFNGTLEDISNDERKVMMKRTPRHGCFIHKVRGKETI